MRSRLACQSELLLSARAVLALCSGTPLMRCEREHEQYTHRYAMQEQAEAAKMVEIGTPGQGSRPAMPGRPPQPSNGVAGKPAIYQTQDGAPPPYVPGQWCAAPKRSLPTHWDDLN